MAVRSVISDGSRPIELDPDERVQHLRAEEAARHGVRDQLLAAGWRHVVATAVPEPIDEARLAAAHSGAILGVDVAEAFVAAVRAEEAAARSRSEALRDEARSLEDELDQVNEHRDQLIDVLGGPPLHRGTVADLLAPLLTELDRVGEADSAGALRGWLDQVRAGTAPMHPTSIELLARARELDVRWAEMGSGAFQSVPAVAAAREERDRLRELVAELEAQLERGLGVEAQQAIEDAHGARVAAEEAVPRRPGRVDEALATEASVLARYGFASYPDYQIATSTGTVGDHARGVLSETIGRLDAATAQLQEVIAETERLGRAVEAERERLSAEAEAWAGDADVDDLLAPPAELSRALSVLTDRLERLTASHAAADDRLVDSAAEAAELGEEIRVREAELVAARQLVVEIDEVVGEVTRRRSAALEELAAAVADHALPGVVVDVATHAVEVEELRRILESGSIRVVLLSD